MPMVVPALGLSLKDAGRAGSAEETCLGWRFAIPFFARTVIDFNYDHGLLPFLRKG